MSVWSFRPQEVFEERRLLPVVTAAVGPITQIAGLYSSSFIQSFRLRYTIVNSATAAGMVDFYQAQLGPFQVFDFTNPNDNTLYSVRFSADMDVTLFEPLRLRTEDIVLTVIPNFNAGGFGGSFGESFGEM